MSSLNENSRENYIASMESHYSNDRVISLEEKQLIEKQLNGHTVQLARILEVGEAHGHWDRVKSALKNKDCHVPVLYGMVKDHKPRVPGAQPKMRWRSWV